MTASSIYSCGHCFKGRKIVGEISEKMKKLLSQANIRPNQKQGGTMIDALRVKRIAAIAKKECGREEGEADKKSIAGN